MAHSVGVYVSDGTLREAALESRLQGASKSQILRFALLRTVMSAREARNTVFGMPDELTETSGRVDGTVPEHEMAMIRNKYPEIPISDLARYGFAIAAGEERDKAWELSTVKRGRPRKSDVSSDAQN